MSSNGAGPGGGSAPLDGAGDVLSSIPGEALRALLGELRSVLAASVAVGVAGALAIPVFALWRPGPGGLLDPEPALRVVGDGGLAALPLDWSPAAVAPSGIALEGLATLLLVLAVAGALAVVAATVAVWSLVVARTRRRGRELGIRSAVGARAGHLRAQLVLEGSLVALAGAAAGGVAGRLAGSGVLAALPAGLTVATGGPAWGWAVLLAVGPPAMAAVAAPVLAAPGRLRRRKGRSTPAGLFRPPPRIGGDLLVAGQAAGLLAALVAAGLLARAHGPGTAPRVAGFEPRDTVVLEMESRDEASRRTPNWHGALAAARAAPGTVSAAVASPGAWAGSGARDRVVAECWCWKGGGFAPVVAGTLRHAVVGPGFFRTLRTSVLAGRTFREADRRQGRRVAVVTETFARRWLAGSGAVGKRIWVAGSGQQAPGYEIVGVVSELRAPGLTTDKPAAPVVYLPDWLHAPARAEMVVRTHGASVDTATRLASAVERGAPGVRVTRGSLLPDAMSLRTEPMRRATVLLAGLLAGTVLLAGLGAGGLAADETASRRAEFGLRRAVGARRVQIVGLAVGAAVRPTVAGIVLGPTLALPLAILLDRLLLAVRPADPLVWISASAVVAVCAALGALGPARRAARDDVARALEAPWI